MKCEEASLLIEELYDDEIDFRLKARVKEHLAGCTSCSADFDRIFRLDQLLEKAPAPPPPSALLDRKLMKAFERHNKESLKSPAWWQRIFVGSVSIPKPAFAAILLAIVATITAAIMIERNRSLSSEISTSVPASSPIVSTPLPPEIIEKTITVEVPVIRERVVTRVVYVERQNSEAIKPQKASSARNGNGENMQKQTLKGDDINLAMNGSIEDGGYVTRANLTGFQPTTELKTRIIQEPKPDEK
jgi:predicted anti-sigma-YlaC factor YlaD